MHSNRNRTIQRNSMARVVVVGNGNLSCQVADLVKLKGHLVGLIAENKESAWDKGFVDYIRSFERHASAHIGNVNNLKQELLSIRPDVIFFQRSAYLVKKPILDIVKIGCVNVHFGELPQYGGCYPLCWALRNGESQVGITLHFMDDKFDSGPVIGLSFVKVRGTFERRVNIFGRNVTVNGFTCEESYRLAAKEAYCLIRNNYELIVSGRFRSTRLSKGEGCYYKKNSIDFKKDIIFYPDKMTDEQIATHILAFTFPSLNQYPIAENGNGGKSTIRLS